MSAERTSPAAPPLCGICIPEVRRRADGTREVRFAFAVDDEPGAATRDLLQPIPRAYRRVPLLSVSPHVIIVARIHLVHMGGVVKLRIDDQRFWRECDGAWVPGEADPPEDVWLGNRGGVLHVRVGDRDGWEERDGELIYVGGAIAATAPDPRWMILEADDPQAHLARLAHAIAEGTRNDIRELSERRSQLEADLTMELREKDAADDTPRKAASLIELARAANMARDHCRDAARGGMSVWRTTDGETGYHQHREHRDPTLLVDARPRRSQTESTRWLQRHDRAVRHLEDAADQLGELSDQIYRLLGGAASAAALKQAQAQGTLNVIAASAAVGLGVPALVFALYGADVLTPFDDAGQRWVLALMAVATVVALLAVQLVLRRRGFASRWLVMALIVAAGTVFLFVVARKGPDPRVIYDCKPQAGAAVVCTQQR